MFSSVSCMFFLARRTQRKHYHEENTKDRKARSRLPTIDIADAIARSWKYYPLSKAVPFSDTCIIFRFTSTRRQVFPSVLFFRQKKQKKVPKNSTCRMAKRDKTYGKLPRRNSVKNYFIVADGLTMFSDGVKSCHPFEGHGG